MVIPSNLVIAIQNPLGDQNLHFHNLIAGDTFGDRPPDSALIYKGEERKFRFLCWGIP